MRSVIMFLETYPGNVGNPCAESGNQRVWPQERQFQYGHSGISGFRAQHSLVRWAWNSPCWHQLRCKSTKRSYFGMQQFQWKRQNRRLQKSWKRTKIWYRICSGGETQTPNPITHAGRWACSYNPHQSKLFLISTRRQFDRKDFYEKPDAPVSPRWMGKQGTFGTTVGKFSLYNETSSFLVLEKIIGWACTKSFLIRPKECSEDAELIKGILLQPAEMQGNRNILICWTQLTNQW